MRLLLIRHGQSIANAEGRIQGHFDTSLSDEGRQQSACLASRLATFRIDAIYCSSLKRARETADALAARLGLPVEELLGLRERDIGELAGLTRQEIRERFADQRRPGLSITALQVPGLESDEDFARRVAMTLRQIASVQAGRTVAVVTHRGVIEVMCRWASGFSRNNFSIGNASITIATLTEDSSADPPRISLARRQISSCRIFRSPGVTVR